MKIKRVFAFFAAFSALFLWTGLSHAQQKLNSGIGQQFPRSDYSPEYAPASQ